MCRIVVDLDIRLDLPVLDHVEPVDFGGVCLVGGKVLGLRGVGLKIEQLGLVDLRVDDKFPAVITDGTVEVPVGGESESRSLAAWPVMAAMRLCPSLPWRGDAGHGTEGAGNMSSR